MPLYDQRLKHSHRNFEGAELRPDLVLVERTSYENMYREKGSEIVLPEEHMYESYIVKVLKVGPSREFPKVVEPGDYCIAFQGIGNPFGDISIVHVLDLRAKVAPGVL